MSTGEPRKPLDVNDNEQFFAWILDTLSEDTGELSNFLQQGDVWSEASEYFNNAWCDYCERMREEDV